MLKLWMYQGYRTFSHSGMCWTTPTRATSSGGRRIAAGMRKTIVVWYDWSRGVRTTKSCATAAHVASDQLADDQEALDQLALAHEAEAQEAEAQEALLHEALLHEASDHAADAQDALPSAVLAQLAASKARY